IRNRVPQGSGAQLRRTEVGVAVRYADKPVSTAKAERLEVTCTLTCGYPRIGVTDYVLRGIVIDDAGQTAINRRSPFRIPPVLVGTNEAPYVGELDTASEG